MADFAEEFGAMLRPQGKRQTNRELVESVHPPEPEPEPDVPAEEFVARLLAPKRWQGPLIDSLHPPGDEAA